MGVEESSPAALPLPLPEELPLPLPEELPLPVLPEEPPPSFRLSVLDDPPHPNATMTSAETAHTVRRRTVRKADMKAPPRT
jgi:hypothetical protein